MNKERLEQLWDEYRDGTISAADRAAFEVVLRTSEPAAAMWKAESQWLEMLGDVDASFAGESHAFNSAAFADRVLTQWRQPEEVAVAGRIGTNSRNPRNPRTYLAWVLGIAAMVAFFMLGAIYSNMLNQGTPATPGPSLVKTPDAKPAAPDALGLLMASAKDSYAIAAAQPAKIKQGFTNTAAFLDVSRLADLLDPNVPDPAKFTEPKSGG